MIILSKLLHDRLKSRHLGLGRNVLEDDRQERIALRIPVKALPIRPVRRRAEKLLQEELLDRDQIETLKQKRQACCVKSCSHRLRSSPAMGVGKSNSAMVSSKTDIRLNSPSPTSRASASCSSSVLIWS